LDLSPKKKTEWEEGKNRQVSTLDLALPLPGGSCGGEDLIWAGGPKKSLKSPKMKCALIQ